MKPHLAPRKLRQKRIPFIGSDGQPTATSVAIAGRSGSLF
jgi:hypothetical protein